jgi:signal transduction histidine kinase/DNA-binding response OmpR family regulator
VLRSLRSKLILLISMLVVVLMGASSAIQIRERQEEMLAALLEDAETFSVITSPKVLGTFTDLYHQPGQFDRMRAILSEALKRSRSFKQVQIVDTLFDVVLFDSKELEQGYYGFKREARRFDAPGALEGLALGQPKVSRVGTGGIGGDVRVIVPLFSGSETVQGTDVNRAAVFTYGTEQVESTIAAMRRSYLWQTAIFILLGLLVAAFESEMVTRPVQRLTSGAQKLRSGELTYRVPVKGSDELATLAASFNEMAESLLASQRELVSANARLERQNHELKELDKLKDQFLANTSHELRTPINGILGLVSAVVGGADGPLNSKQQRHLAMVKDSTENLKDLINRLLDLSKMRMQGIQLEPRRFALSDLVPQLQTLGAGLLAQKPIQLSIELPPDLPEVFGDPDRIRQVLSDLLGNAAKFTQKGRIRLCAKEKDDEVLVFVADTGIGIQREMHQAIFEEFRQVDGGASRQYEGTGLGLAISKRTVEAHGGKIWVDSEPGQGSTFYFTLPTKAFAPEVVPVEPPKTTVVIEPEKEQPEAPRANGAPKSEPARAPERRAPAGTGERVLVVDDMAVNVESLALQLESHGYRPLRATSGQQALQILSENPSQAVITDVMMPGMTGYDLCRAIRSTRGHQRTPVVLLTAQAGTVQDKLLGFEAGATDYVVKPFEPAELFARLHTLLHPPTAPGEIGGNETNYDTILDRRTGSSAAAPAHGRIHLGQGERILCVDDNPMNLEVLKTQLEAANFKVDLAKDGVEALEKIEKAQPDLMLIDLMMPRMDGYELCEKIKADPTLRAIPLVIVSARDRAEDEIYAFKLGVADYVTKPFDGQVLAAKISAMFALTRAHEALGKLNSTLELARKVQQSVMPAGVVDLPGATLRGFTQAADETGGDWYGYLVSPAGDRITLVLADVEGHGVPAALLTLVTATIKSILSLIDGANSTASEAILGELTKLGDPVARRVTALLAAPHSPGRLLELLNAVFLEMKSTLTMSCLALTLQPKTGLVTYALAAHPPPHFLRVSPGPEQQVWGAPSSHIGSAETHFEEQTTTLQPGDSVVCFSDGLPEASNPQGAPFHYRGIRRLLADLARAQPEARTAERVRDALVGAVFKHMQDTALGDDLTIVVLRREPLS